VLKTVVDNLSEAATELERLLSELLLKHSVIYEWNRREPGDQVVFLSASGDYAFRDLQVEGRRLQAKLLETIAALTRSRMRQRYLTFQEKNDEF